MSTDSVNPAKQKQKESTEQRRPEASRGQASRNARNGTDSERTTLIVK